MNTNQPAIIHAQVGMTIMIFYQENILNFKT